MTHDNSDDGDDDINATWRKLGVALPLERNMARSLTSTDSLPALRIGSNFIFDAWNLILSYIRAPHALDLWIINAKNQVSGIELKWRGCNQYKIDFHY